MLTQEVLKTLLSYDPETGSFKWLSGGRRRVLGAEAGYLRKDGYVHIGVAGSLYLAHRLAWLYMTGSFPILKIDHKNGICSDTRWSNLRLATSSQNSCNSRLAASNTSGVKGICWHNKSHRWIARVGYRGKRYLVGYFDSLPEAQAATIYFREVMHGKFANNG
ncbi:putative homing endonuclease [Pectobacterium phage Arno18]|uniref:Putative homing endonuclease n=1 Tax=Pectobacterium phage Arno18 TaxID=2500578 RepID=A0A678ZK53_9CAUD|nr:putative homing endonuclease [Pectobacterium phage Arno18]